MKEPKKKKVRLSYSALSTLDKCSWLYHCQYVLKLPDKSNDGAKRGTVVHDIFEILTKEKRHKKHVKQIIETEDVKMCEPIRRLAIKFAKRGEVDSLENIDIIYGMIVTGLKNDFYCKGATTVKAEGQFLLNAKEGYEMKGFIDKAAVYKDGSARIVDYKGSKSKFKKKELADSIQAQMYSLAYYEMHGVIPQVEFLFLRFPNNPVQRFKLCTKAGLAGFKYYLDHVAKGLEVFDEKAAKQRFAGAKPWPKPEDGFSGPLICGRAKQKGQLKKDNTPMWHCSQKFPYDYYAQVDEDGKVYRTAFEEEELKEKEGYKIEKKHYEGCPYFNKSTKFVKNDEDPFDF